ncbi:hypothetical protein GCM10027442_53120 [Emticicia fontis]
MVDVIGLNEDTDLVNDLKALNVKIVAHHKKIVTCLPTFDQLNAIGKLKSCRWLQPTRKPLTRSGNVLSQGDAAQRSDIARNLTGLNGAGVKVGIMSDSYNLLGGAAAGVNAGELPGTGNPNGYTTPVTVLSESTIGADEGRAMAEIVHDVAPGAQLYYYSAFKGEPDFANGILALAQAGCKVIVDDIGYLTAPYFQDGIVAQAVDYVTSNYGVSYFSAAGNDINNSYEAPYKSSTYFPFSGYPDIAHNFGTNANPVYLLPIAVEDYTLMVLEWDDPYASIDDNSPGASSDVDLYVFADLGDGLEILTAGYDTNIGYDPVELVEIGGTGTVYIMITKYSGADPRNLKLNGYYGFSWSGTPTSIAGIKKSTLIGHPNAAGAIAVGAASYHRTPAYGVTPPVIESYSSLGGTPIYRSVAGALLPSGVIRQKPEIVAPDNANTSFFISGYDFEGDGSPNFSGTSAAAPHAAGVAALMRQAKTNITVNEIKTSLINSCTDMNTTGFDFLTGNGLIKADNAVLSLYSVTASTPSNTSFCQGTDISISFSSVGKFGTNNQYKLQLSNSSGSFNSPIEIGTLTSTANSGTINGVIPAETTAGSNYKVRVIASKPSKNSNEIAITITVIPSAPSTISASRCGMGTVTLSASGCSGGTIKWYENATTTTVLTTGSSYTTPNINDTTIYYVGCTNGNCTSSRAQVTATVTPAPVTPSVVSASRCGTGTVTLSASGCIGGTIKWYENTTTTTVLTTGTSYTTPTISSNTTYYVGCTIEDCESSRVSATAFIAIIPGPPSTVSGSRCGTGTVMLSASGCTSGTIRWYTNTTTTTVLTTGNSYTTPTISNTTTYYVNCSNGNCLSNRVPITATITTAPEAPTTTSVSRCGAGTVTLTASGCSGGTIKWFASASATTALTTGGSYTTPGIGSSTTYYVSCTIGNCVSSRSQVTATVNINLSFTNPTQASGTYRASQTITSSSNVANPTSYYAGNAIILVPGFQAGSGEVFLASIQNCP